MKTNVLRCLFGIKQLAIVSRNMEYRIMQQNWDTINSDKAYFGRAKDVYHQEAFSETNNPNSKLYLMGS